MCVEGEYEGPAVTRRRYLSRDAGSRALLEFDEGILMVEETGATQLSGNYMGCQRYHIYKISLP